MDHPFTQSLVDVPLAPSLLQQLTKAGIGTVEEILNLGPVALAEDLEIEASEALSIIHRVKEAMVVMNASGKKDQVGSVALMEDHHDEKSSASPSQALEVRQNKVQGKETASISSDIDLSVSLGGHSALAKLEKEKEMLPISTGSKALDSLLGGGIALGQLSEFYGLPGIGKTQLGMQLAVNAAAMSCSKDTFGECIYIDSEGSFIAERVLEIAKQSHPKLDIEALLSRIHVYRVHDYLEQLAAVYLLPSFLKEHPCVRLIVVDSISFHFRHGFSDAATRTRCMLNMARSFQSLASLHSVGVVLFNQVTTKVDKSMDKPKTLLIPALGERWAHVCSTRVLLAFEKNHRCAILRKCSFRQSGFVPILINHCGIRDIPSVEKD